MVLEQQSTFVPEIVRRSPFQSIKCIYVGSLILQWNFSHFKTSASDEDAEKNNTISIPCLSEMQGVTIPKTHTSSLLDRQADHFPPRCIF